MEDASESILNVVNSIEPKLAIILIIGIWLRVTLLAHRRHTGDETE